MFRKVPLSIIRSFYCTHSNGICHTSLLTVYEQVRDGSVLILLASCHQTCVYSARLLMIDRGTLRIM